MTNQALKNQNKKISIYKKNLENNFNNNNNYSMYNRNGYSN